MGVFFYFRNLDEEDDDLIVDDSIKKKESGDVVVASSEDTITYMVDIKGEVNSPGIYSMPSSSRVIDVVMKAGGFTEGADTSVINLSKKIQDEMVIIIYSHDQVENFYETLEREKQVLNQCKSMDGNLVNGACIESDTVTTSKVNINTAGKDWRC